MIRRIVHTNSQVLHGAALEDYEKFVRGLVAADRHADAVAVWEQVVEFVHLPPPEVPVSGVRNFRPLRQAPCTSRGCARCAAPGGLHVPVAWHLVEVCRGGQTRAGTTCSSHPGCASLGHALATWQMGQREWVDPRMLPLPDAEQARRDQVGRAQRSMVAWLDASASDEDTYLSTTCSGCGDLCRRICSHCLRGLWQECELGDYGVACCEDLQSCLRELSADIFNIIYYKHYIINIIYDKLYIL